MALLGSKEAEAPVLSNETWPAHRIGAKVSVAPPQPIWLARGRTLLLPKALARHACTVRAPPVVPKCRIEESVESPNRSSRTVCHSRTVGSECEQLIVAPVARW